jgi:hypothetical protein
MARTGNSPRRCRRGSARSSGATCARRTHGFRSAYGRLSPLTARRAPIGKVCNGSGAVDSRQDRSLPLPSISNSSCKGSIALPFVIKSGWPLAVRRAAKGVKATQGFATCVGGSVSACSECSRMARLRCWWVPPRRCRAETQAADPVSSRNTAAGRAILFAEADHDGVSPARPRLRSRIGARPATVSRP